MTAADIRQVVEGTLTEQGRELRNMQVMHTEGELSTHITLRDAAGVFLQATPEEREEEESEVKEEEDGADNVGEGAVNAVKDSTLQQEVDEMKLANESLKARVGELQEALEKE